MGANTPTGKITALASWFWPSVAAAETALLRIEDEGGKRFAMHACPELVLEIVEAPAGSRTFAQWAALQDEPVGLSEGMYTWPSGMGEAYRPAARTGLQTARG
jgi:hypothetical protein